jgi:DNA-binding transcriptional LysR family regulator
MTLRQLEYLLAVTDAGSFTRAAAHLHVSQPSLSQQIQALERELGGRLLDRPPKPVRLTAAGRAFVAKARVAVNSADAAARAARRVMELEPERIRVATVQSLAVSPLTSCLQRWCATRPAVVTTVHAYEHRRDMQEAVREDGAEVAIGPAPADWDGAYELIGWDELVAVLPPGDGLLQSARPVSLCEMADRGWVLFDESNGLAETVAQVFAAVGVEARPALRTTHVEAAASLAATGVGPTLVPRTNVPAAAASLVRQLDPPVVWEIGAFAVGASFDDLSRSFVECVAEGEWQRDLPLDARVLAVP